MRKPALVLFLALAVPAYASPPLAAVDLDRPGVLERIARDDPTHYAKILAVLDAARVHPCETLPGILKTQLDVPQADCTAYLLLTSNPPKLHLTFRLDQTSYMSNVAQGHLGGQLFPAK